MCPATVAETMMGAMISVAQEKAAAGNYAEAVQTITTFIETVEDGDDKVRRTFGANLVPLYCLRAKAHFEASLTTVEAQVDQAAAELWGITERELREIRRSLEELG